MNASSTTSNKDDDTNTSLTLASASRFPLMRRVDQHFTLQSKLENYGEEISRVSGRNKTALASLGSQERRIREMQALLRGESSSSDDHQTDTNNDISQQQYDQQSGTTTENNNDDALVGQTHQPISHDSSVNESDNVIATSSMTGETNDYQITSVPAPPTNFRVTQISHDSFTAVWDTTTNDDQQTIVEYEIKYSYSTTSIEGEDDDQQQQVQTSCSRWCIKQPVSTNGHQVENLQPNTQYTDIAIRCRSSVGWSEFSNSINSITTTSKDEDHDKRRKRFLYRIGHIEQSISSLEAVRHKLPTEQVLLARNMSRMQDRLDELDSEIERVTSHVGNELLSSHLLHGAEQSFTKAALKYKLEHERTICRLNIAHWRAGIIDMDKESSEIADEIQEKKSRLDERKAALLKFDKQYALVSTMKNVVSKRPIDLKRYYIAQWRSRVSNRLDVKHVIESLARSCRRRIYSGAWRQLCSLVSSRQEAEQKRRNVQADGIGGLLLNVAKCSVEENLSDASYLIGVVNEIKDNHQDDEQRGGETPTTTNHNTHLLCKEDKDLLVKGDFLFNAQHYESSLQCYQQVLSKMEVPNYFTEASTTSTSTTKDIIALFAQVNGKIGHAYIKLCSYDLAIVYFGRQLELANEEDLDAARTEALLGLGMSYVGKYDYVYAETLLRRALDLCLSRGDRVNELLVYKQLQTCCECLNRPQEASVLADKIQSMDTSSWECDSEVDTTVVSRKTVDHTLQELDNMRLRLINVIANQSKVVQLEVASAHRVHLQKTKFDKEEQLRDALEQLSNSKQLASELFELISQIEYEIHEAKHTKKKRFISSLLQGSKQNVKTTELLIRLDEELKVVRAKHEECLAADIPRIEMLIHNTRDDIHVLEEELVIEEGPLMQRVIEGRKYRCIALNANKDVDLVVSSEGSNCYVHSLSSGKLDNVFIVDGEGEDNGASSTITALYFYGNHIYSGTMSSVLIGWDVSSSKQMFVAKGHEAAITCIFADDSKIVSGSADKCIIVWSKDGELLRRVGGHDHGIHALQCGPSFCVSSSYSTVYVWDIEKRKTDGDKIKEFKCRGRLVLPEGNVTTLQYGELEVITGDSLGYVTVFWIESSEILQRFKAHESAVTSIQVDATKAVSCGSDMMIAISDVIRGHVLQRLRGHNFPIRAVCFNRKQITSVSLDGQLRLWSLR